MAVAMEARVKVEKYAHFKAFSVLVAMATGIKCYRNIENHKKINLRYSVFNKIHDNSAQNHQNVNRIQCLKGSSG